MKRFLMLSVGLAIVSGAGFAHAGQDAATTDAATTKAVPEGVRVVKDAPPPKGMGKVTTPAPAAQGAAQEEIKTQAPKMETKSAPKMTPKTHAHKAEWGYTGATSAQHWGDLDPAYAACKDGQKQSPVNIDGGQDIDLPPITLNYKPAALSVTNKGHGIRQNYGLGSFMEVGGEKYELLQVYFHTPSEHYIRGMAAPMEAHFVHKAADGTLAVLGVMMRVDRANDTIQKIWSGTPAAGETKGDGKIGINARNLLPQNLEYFRYDGSLTTPPCSEGVKWHVLKTPIEISEDQLRAYQGLFPVNARPIQPLNGRVISR